MIWRVIPESLHNLAPRLGYKHVLRRMKDRMVKWLRDTNDGIVNDGGLAVKFLRFVCVRAGALRIHR